MISVDRADKSENIQKPCNNANCQDCVQYRLDGTCHRNKKCKRATRESPLRREPHKYRIKGMRSRFSKSDGGGQRRDKRKRGNHKRPSNNSVIRTTRISPRPPLG